jgi:hypothetical protein
MEDDAPSASFASGGLARGPGDSVPLLLAHVPPGRVMPPGLAAELAARLEQLPAGPPRLLTPLPRRVRLRLACQGAVDDVATWLAGHGRWRAAERTWRAFRMLRK